MNLSMLPKDVLILLALEMDIEYVINLCKTSSIFNQKICKNEHFWKNKLFKDYEIEEDLHDAKDEYLSIRNDLKNNPQDILSYGINTENYKLVKASLEWGADPNIKILSNYPITLSMYFDNAEILIYLLDYVDSENYKLILNDIFLKFEYQNTINKIKSFINLLDIFLPYIVKFPEINKSKNFWSVAVYKLEEIYKDKYITDKFYNKWINFYKKLAE